MLHLGASDGEELRDDIGCALGHILELVDRLHLEVGCRTFAEIGEETLEIGVGGGPVGIERGTGDAGSLRDPRHGEAPEDHGGGLGVPDLQPGFQEAFLGGLRGREITRVDGHGSPGPMVEPPLASGRTVQSCPVLCTRSIIDV